MSDLLRFDLSKNSIGRPIVFGRVGDGESFSMRVQIFKDGAPFDLTDWVATFEGVTHEERTKVFDSDGIEITNGKNGEFTYTFPNMAFAVAGSYELAYFSFMKDDKRESTDDFEITVYGNADIDAEEAKTIITEYNKLVKALNEAYQSALEKMNTDYDEVEKRIEAIKVDLNTLKKQITDILVDAEGRISAIGKSVTDEVDAALEKFKEGNFYTKQEADNRFLSKTENLDIQNKKLTNDDGSGLPLPKGVTSFKELSGYAGFYYLDATVAGTMTDKADLPPEFKYSALYVYQHAIAGTAGSMYQEIRMNSLATPLIAFRTTSPNSSQNSPFKVLATTDSVVNLSNNQEIAGVKNFSDGLQISGKNLTDSLMEMLLNVGKKIWEGAAYLNETQSVKPSIPLDKCFTGWVALYQPYDSNTGKAQPWDLNYMFIPKTHAVDYSGVAIVHHLETLNGAKFNKYIYVTNTEIKGHKNNGTAAKDYVITKLYSV
ncbi:BppU family phage baseplate upper protein [Enterococcus faecalis]|uniref:BppU family phage baseplate upper protein n=1 Tax=Enterococcus faecalis TaxID=1351 RepID=UPI001E543A05|nr:BppU family phage baseplate upper protein [Enterococcus faecalis]MCD4917737.1 BppU family phage baseplate upper protein [Enterococcus faecalis]